MNGPSNAGVERPGGFWAGFWTFWERRFSGLPPWPSERQWVTIWVVAIFLIMLSMAFAQPALWEVETFKTILQAVVITGLINMVLAFHFSANQGQSQSSANTAEALKLAHRVQDRDRDRPSGTREDPVHVEDETERTAR